MITFTSEELLLLTDEQKAIYLQYLKDQSKALDKKIEEIKQKQDEKTTQFPKGH